MTSRSGFWMASRCSCCFVDGRSFPCSTWNRNWPDTHALWRSFTVTFLASINWSPSVVVSAGVTLRVKMSFCFTLALKSFFRIGIGVLLFVFWNWWERGYFHQFYPPWVSFWHLKVVRVFPWGSWDVRRYFWWVLFWTCGSHTYWAEITQKSTCLMKLLMFLCLK